MSRALNMLRYYAEKIGYGVIGLLLFTVITVAVIYSILFLGKEIIITGVNLPSGVSISALVNGEYREGFGNQLIVSANMFKTEVQINSITSASLLFQTLYIPSPRVIFLTKYNSSNIEVNFTRIVAPNYLLVATESSFNIYTYNPYTNNIAPYRVLNGIENITGAYFINITGNPSVFEPSFNYIVLTTSLPKIFLVNTSTFIPTPQITNSPVLFIFPLNNSYGYSIIEVFRNGIYSQSFGPYSYYVSQSYKTNMNITSAALSATNNLICTNGTNYFVELGSNYQPVATVPLNNQYPILALYSGPLTIYGEYAFVVTNKTIIVVNQLSDTLQSVIKFDKILAYSSALGYLAVATVNESGNYVYIYNESTAALVKQLELPYSPNAILYTGNYLLVANSTNLNVLNSTDKLVASFNIPNIRVLE
jgi:hypothetical protein